MFTSSKICHFQSFHQLTFLKYNLLCLQWLPLTRALKGFFLRFKPFGGRQSTVTIVFHTLFSSTWKNMSAWENHGNSWLTSTKAQVSTERKNPSRARISGNHCKSTTRAQCTYVSVLLFTNLNPDIAKKKKTFHSNCNLNDPPLH